MRKGGCFVVQASDCLFWTGERWSADVGEALEFRGPPDPWARCRKEVDSLRAGGVRCDVAYVPLAEVAPAKVASTPPAAEAKKGGGGVMIVVILLVLAAIGFAVWKFVLHK